MLDDITELGTAAPWIYRGWVYLFSPRYRREQHRRWRSAGFMPALLDVLATIAFFVIEVAFLWWAARGLLSL